MQPTPCQDATHGSRRPRGLVRRRVLLLRAVVLRLCGLSRAIAPAHFRARAAARCNITIVLFHAALIRWSTLRATCAIVQGKRSGHVGAHFGDDRPPVGHSCAGECDRITAAVRRSFYPTEMRLQRLAAQSQALARLGTARHGAVRRGKTRPGRDFARSHSSHVQHAACNVRHTACNLCEARFLS
jgi:hypothetical protein